MDNVKSKKSSPVKELLITRVFNAPRELVFSMWTDPKHFAKWWGPKNFTAPVCELDARPGGAILIHMQGPDGIPFPVTGVFHEVKRPERIVYTSFAFGTAEEPGIEALNTLEFIEHGDKTTMRLHVSVIRVSAEIEPALGGMSEGWGQSFDKLDEEISASR
jgi:uncharacterized protein YndB with AHSA1/START domain